MVMIVLVAAGPAREALYPTLERSVRLRSDLRPTLRVMLLDVLDLVRVVCLFGFFQARVESVDVSVGRGRGAGELFFLPESGPKVRTIPT